MTSLFDVAKQANMFYGQAAYNGFEINLDIYKKMPQEMKTILQEEIDKKISWMNTTMRQLEKDDIKTLKDKGIKINVVSKAEREKWAKFLESFNQKQIEKFGDFGTKIKKIADQANAKFPYKEMAID